MKCPNCGKEALFVNGKYVCVDCGIEITPEQQAFQNQANDQAPEPVIPETPTAEVQVENQEPTVAPVTMPDVANPTPADNSNFTAPPVTEIPEAEKPVQQYYENALSQDDNQPAISGTKPGVYDFDTPSAPTAPAVPDIASEPAPEVVEAPHNGSPSEPSTVIMPEQPEAVTPTETPEYFSPNSFDMNANQASPASADSTPTPELAAETPPITTPEEVLNQPEAGSQTLDEMLGSTPDVASVTESSPASAYGPASFDTVTPEPTTSNIASEKSMPTVESVFGTDKNTTGSNPSMPTPQDFGVAPKPQPQKRKIPMPLIIGGVVGLLFIIGIVVTLLLLSGEKKPNLPVTLTEAEINTLSAGASTAMQQPQGISVAYSFGADYSGLIVKDGVKDKEALQELFETPYALTGNWYTDQDGDITVDTKVGAVTDKRTYLSSSSSTLTYNPKKKAYVKESGMNLIGVPTIFGVEEKTALFYTTNVKSATLLGTEQVDGIDTNKYQLKVGEEIVKDSLDVLGTTFSEAEYQSLNTDNLVVYAWMTNDSKLKKITLSGSVSLETDKFSGNLSLTGEAVYSYLEVTIEDPSASPGAAANTDNPVSQTPAANNKEEGETSSINSGTKKPLPKVEPLVEAKG